MLTDREKFLMIQWGKCHENYETVDEWLNTVIDDVGHTVEQKLSYDADQAEIAKCQKEASGYMTPQEVGEARRKAAGIE